MNVFVWCVYVLSDVMARLHGSFGKVLKGGPAGPYGCIPRTINDHSYLTEAPSSFLLCVCVCDCILCQGYSTLTL